MSDKFGLGVIGTGAVANIRANAVNTLKEIEIVAACDLVEARVKDYVDRHGVYAASGFCNSCKGVLGGGYSGKSLP